MPLHNPTLKRTLTTNTINDILLKEEVQQREWGLTFIQRTTSFIEEVETRHVGIIEANIKMNLKDDPSFSKFSNFIQSLVIYTPKI